jgi:hypothetical protein
VSRSTVNRFLGVLTASLLVALAADVPGPSDGASEYGPGLTMQTSIEEAQRDLADRVMALPGVVGVAIGQCDGEPCIKVLVAARTADLAGKIPARFKGYAVAIDETGELRAPRPPTPPTR